MAERISLKQGKDAFDQGEALFVDIRDPESFAQAHLQGALHLTQQSVDQFIADTASDQPLVVYCYHGNSSQNAADWLTEQGFQKVVSLDGGFEQFRVHFPHCLSLTA